MCSPGTSISFVKPTAVLPPARRLILYPFMGASPSKGASHSTLIVERAGSLTIGAYLIFEGGCGRSGIFPVVIIPYISEDGVQLKEPHITIGA